MRMCFLLLVSLCWLTPATAEPNPSRLPSPKVGRPELPADGSGIYRLNLDQALGVAPLTLLLHVQQDQVTQAAALPNRNAQAWCAVDASKLVCHAERLHGAVTVYFTSVFDPAEHRQNTVEGKPNPKYQRFELKPIAIPTSSLGPAAALSAGVRLVCKDVPELGSQGLRR